MARGVVIGGLNSGGGKSVKSSQTGEAIIPGNALSVTVTINAVDSTKAMIFLSYSTDAGTPRNREVKGVLATGTTITFTRDTANSSAVSIGWTVVEYDNIKSLQSGTLAHSGANTEAVVNISSIDISKCLLIFSYTDTNTSGFVSVRAKINNASQLSFLRNNYLGTSSIYWRLIEFK